MASKFILIPIIHARHWTLLVANLTKKVWEFYDSLPKATHTAVLTEVIEHFYEQANQAFDEDIRKWVIESISNIPVQANSYDCEMFVYKYMEAIIQPEPVRWSELKDWQTICLDLELNLHM
ncbi:hypothetical protein IEQ34_012231 [Dendrobium chrysotoxum]|uniref:Ubiquitin-like protease family profile domain-containing protein n=1 Tax=Dendrobium chrysotoxum TaxID=161865 RepID=A0AAV7GSP1_DENCH|nr:hypothetical protein IEQ34_012231 [Dendrobium chrysotoxum]